MIINTNENIKIKDYFKKEIEESINNVIAAKVNNEIVSLNHIVQSDDDVELIDLTDKEGMRVYTNGLLFILGKAFNNIYPEAKITVQHNISNKIYCEVVNMKVTDEVLRKVEYEMHDLVNRNLDIVKVQMTKEEAEKFYNETGSSRGKLQLYAKEKEKVSLYYSEDYYNYFYGCMAISTGFMKIFRLEPYNKNFVIRYPSSEEPNKIADGQDNTKLLKALNELEVLHKQLNVDTVHKLNEIVEKGDIKDTILLAEALHEKRVAEIASQIAKRKDTKMVLIAGPSSSGKTTFAQRLGIQLRVNGLKPVTISVDNYFVERQDTPKDENGQYDFENLEAIDLKLFNDHITRLLRGETVKVPTFNFHIGSKEYKGNTMSLKEDEILVIEGIHCLNDKLTSSVSKDKKYKIYISALATLNVDYYNRISTTDNRLIRRIVRDYQYRGYSASHTLQMWPSVRKGEKKNIFPYQEEADSMFNSALVYELGVLKTYALPLLKEISRDDENYITARRLYDFLRYFEDISTENIPQNSLIREFVGGSIFE